MENCEMTARTDIYSKKSIVKYLTFAFAGAWLLQLLSVWAALNSSFGIVGQLLYTVCNSLCMLAPMVAVLLVCRGLGAAKAQIRWRLTGKGIVKGLLIAFVVGPVLAALGATLYFVLLPHHFSTDNATFSSLASTAQSAGMSTGRFIAIYSLSVIPGGFINMLFALGEEVGWSGYLVPALKSHFGRNCAVLLRGIIWGIWHWPLILLAGYEYGTGYFGAPFTGMLAMLLFTTAMGVVMVWTYESCKTIWAPALAHGVLNAFAGFPILFLKDGITSYLLGPTIAGLISGIPLFVFAAILAIRAEKNSR